MTDQEKKELIEAIEMYESVSKCAVFPNEFQLIINAAKKLLYASDSLPEKFENCECKDSAIYFDVQKNKGVCGNCNKEIGNEKYNYLIDQCTATVATHYVSKKDLPFDEVEKEINLHCHLEHYEKMAGNIVKEALERGINMGLRIAINIFHDRIIGGKK